MNATIPAAAPPSFLDAVQRLVRLDLRRFRLLAALVVAIELGRAAVAEWTVRGAPALIGERFGGVTGIAELALLDSVSWLTMVVTTVIVVQADLPSDDRTFWRTRPIPPLALAAGKLATCGLLFVVAPWVVNTARLVAYSAPSASLLASAVQFAVLAGFTVVPVWALALIARTLPRFIGLVLAVTLGGYLLLGAIVYWSQIFAAVAGGIGAIGVRPWAFDWQRLETRGWWDALLITSAGAAILMAHYRHRRGLVSGAAAAGLLVGVFLLPPRVQTGPVPEALVRLVDGRLHVVGLSLPPPSLIESRRRSPVPFPLDVGASLALPPLPSDVSAAAVLRRARLRGRRIVEAGDAWQCCFGPGPIGAIANSLAGTASVQVGHGAYRSGLGVSLDDLAQLNVRSIGIDADAEVRFTQHHLAAEIPMRPGVAVQVGRRRIEVLDVEPRRSALLIRYTDFPTLDAPASQLRLFVGRPDRRLVSPTQAGWSQATPREALLASRTLTTGRRWVGRHHVSILEGKGMGPDWVIYLVESRPIGSASLRLSQSGVRVYPTSSSSSSSR